MKTRQSVQQKTEKYWGNEDSDGEGVISAVRKNEPSVCDETAGPRATGLSGVRQTQTNPTRSPGHVAPEEQDERTNEPNELGGTEDVLMATGWGDWRGGDPGDGVRSTRWQLRGSHGVWSAAAGRGRWRGEPACGQVGAESGVASEVTQVSPLLCCAPGTDVMLQVDCHWRILKMFLRIL